MAVCSQSNNISDHWGKKIIIAITISKEKRRKENKRKNLSIQLFLTDEPLFSPPKTSFLLLSRNQPLNQFLIIIIIIIIIIK